MRRILLVTLSTSVLSALVISNAYAQKQQFYSTVVYLLNSNRTLGVCTCASAVYIRACGLTEFVNSRPLVLCGRTLECCTTSVGNNGVGII